MPLPNIFKRQWKMLKDVFSQYVEDDIFTHSAALGYYTILSLPPTLLVLLKVISLFYEKTTVEAAIFDEIAAMIGQEPARQLSSTIAKLSVLEPTWWATAIGLGTLLFTSTTVFATLQNALNRIFRVKAKPKTSGILTMLKARLLSFAMLLGVAFILLVSLVVDAMISAFGKYVGKYISEFSAVLAAISSILLPLAVTTVLFAMIFKFLPDAKLKWRNTWLGAGVTALLFGVGKYLIGYYIGNSNVAGLYDAAGGVMVIMVWVFYASAIVLFGAVITKVWFNKTEGEIVPEDFAVKVKKTEAVVKKGAEADPSKKHAL
jgi:membrane protein